MAALGIAAAVAFAFRDVVMHMASVSDYGDPLFSIWRMGWVQHQLTTDPMHLFDANIFHPQLLTLTLSDPIVLPALMQAPLLAIGMHPVVAYNALFLFVIWLSGLTMYVLTERLTGSASAAFVGGLVFACYPFRVDHISHLEMQVTPWMPLALLALHRFVSGAQWRYAFAFAGALVAQLYSSMYYAVFFTVYATVIGAGLVRAHGQPVRRLLLPAAAAALAACLAAAPLIKAFVDAQPMKGDRQVDEVRMYSAVWGDYLSGQRFSLWWADRTDPKPERSLFPGVAPLVLAGIGLGPPFSAIRLVYGAGLLIAVDGSRGFNGVVYPYLYDWLPPFRGLRVPARFGILVGLTLSVLAAFGTARLLRRFRLPVPLLTTAVCAFVMVDGLSKIDTVVPVWKEAPSIYQRVKNTPGAVLADLPVGEPPPDALPFQYFSLWHWKPMVGGYSGFLPPHYVSLRKALMTFPRGASVAELRRLGVTHVTINCALPFVPRETCGETARLIAASSDLRLIEETRWEGEPVRLYELIR